MIHCFVLRRSFQANPLNTMMEILCGKLACSAQKLKLFLSHHTHFNCAKKMEKLYNYLFKPERNVTDVSLELIDFKFRELCEFTRDYWQGCYHSCDLYAPHAINAHYKKWSEFITFTNMLDLSAQKIIKELPKYKQLLTDFDEISALNTEYEREYEKCGEDAKCRYNVYCIFSDKSKQSVIWNIYNMYMVHDIQTTSLLTREETIL